MSVKENPNKSQEEEVREEIPEGVGYGSQKSTYDTMNELADSLNKESEQKTDNQ